MENRSIGMLNLFIEPIIQYFITPTLHYSSTFSLNYTFLRLPGFYFTAASPRLVIYEIKKDFSIKNLCYKPIIN